MLFPTNGCHVVERKSSFVCLHEWSTSPALYLAIIHTSDYGRHLRYVSATNFKTAGTPQCMRLYWPFLPDVMVMTMFDRWQDRVNRAVGLGVLRKSSVSVGKALVVVVWIITQSFLYITLHLEDNEGCKRFQNVQFYFSNVGLWKWDLNWVCISGVVNVGPGEPQSCRVLLLPNQTHLNKLIKVWRVTRKSSRQVCFNKGWSCALQDCGSPGPVCHPWCILELHD